MAGNSRYNSMERGRAENGRGLNDPNYGVGFEDGYERDEPEELNDELHEFFYGERPQDLRDLAEFNESDYGTVATASGESSAGQSNTLVTPQELTRAMEIAQRPRLRSRLPSPIPDPRRSVLPTARAFVRS